MRRKISLIIGAMLVAIVLAVALCNLPAPAIAGLSRVLPPAALNWFDPQDEVSAPSPDFSDDGSVVNYVIGPQKDGIQEIRVWAIRNGTKYGWVQLPKGTPVQLLREEGSWLVVRYDQSVVKVHRSVADAGLVVPVTKRGKVATL